MKLFRNVIEFYGTIGVPFLYGLGLWLIVDGEKMNLPPVFQIGGLLATIIGLSLWIVSYLYLGKSFGVLPRRQKRVSQGIYRYIKHPMYKGIMLTYLGLSMANLSYDGAWYSVLVLFPLLYIRARLEDKKLR
jgi:protein-S-isoprenylcysteine O-methyltransferase Ste14